MTFEFQRTLKNSVNCFGVGLHSGRATSLKLIPAPENTGIIFIRTDIDERNEIKADYKSVVNTTLSTTIANEYGVKISTIEHLMAALWGCSIDNVIIEVNGPEVPIMDGSSEPFVFIIECAGIVEQSSPRKVMEVINEFSVVEEGASVFVRPADKFIITMEIEFESKLIASQKLCFDSRDLSFKMDICRARTFGFAHEVEKLRSLGLIQGGSLENAIVIQDDKILNEGGLRYKDEFVRHKMLDFLGDFYLGGAYVKGHFHCIKSGHSLNNKLLRYMMDNDDLCREIPSMNSTFGLSSSNDLRLAS